MLIATCGVLVAPAGWRHALLAWAHALASIAVKDGVTIPVPRLVRQRD
ncbi:MAG: hypothetical protein WBX11_10625 [Thiobacillaceae bacterium]|jgi:hypothetical protein